MAMDGSMAIPVWQPMASTTPLRIRFGIRTSKWLEENTTCTRTSISSRLRGIMYPHFVRIPPPPQLRQEGFVGPHAF